MKIHLIIRGDGKHEFRVTKQHRQTLRRNLRHKDKDVQVIELTIKELKEAVQQVIGAEV